jgi:putative ABC transport system permease protein
MYVALRELWAARARFALVGAVIALVAMMATLLSGLAAGLVDDGISGLRQLPMTHLAMEPGSKGNFSRSILTPANLKPWEHVNGVEASPIGVSFANAKGARGESASIALFGVAPGSFLAPRPDAQQALAGPQGLVLSHTLEKQGIKVGDRLTIAGSEQTLPVLGFTYTGSYGHVPIAFTQLSTWQQVFYGKSANGRFSAIALNVSKGANLAAINQVAQTETMTKTAAYAGSPGYSGETQTMSLIRTFLLAISALVVGSFFTVWTIQRVRQIALMKALGGTTSYVLRDSLGQIAIVQIIATVIGATAAVLLGLAIEGGSVPFHLEAGPVASTVGLLIALGMLGCLIAIRRITRMDPAAALRSVD